VAAEEGLEITQVDEHSSFEDNLGTGGNYNKKIRAHVAHALNHDGCHKA